MPHRDQIGDAGVLPQPPPTLSAREAATAFDVHISTIYRWIDDGLLEVIRPGRPKQEGRKARGGAIRIPESAVIAKLSAPSATA